jgi:hypothetical protein
MCAMPGQLQLPLSVAAACDFLVHSSGHCSRLAGELCHPAATAAAAAAATADRSPAHIAVMFVPV